jgi:hypothetical protein
MYFDGQISTKKYAASVLSAEHLRPEDEERKFS